MTRRCSHCSHNGHNSRTCPNRGVKLFGVRLTDGLSSIRKSASMGNLSHYSGSGGALGNPSGSPGGGGDTPDHAADGYASEDFVAGSSSSRERKKVSAGTPWTEEEHRMFLLGLQKLGKGDWRGIARNYVITRTPTQVASHAQKFFIRQSNVSRRKRRSSLFDIVADEPADMQMVSQDFIPVDHYSAETHGDDPLQIAASPPPPPLNEECESMESTNSNDGEPLPLHSDSSPSCYPVVYPTYISPFFPFPLPCWTDPTKQERHEIVKPTAVHSKSPINVDELIGISKLSLGESMGDAGPSPLSLKLLDGSTRQSAFNPKPASSGSSWIEFRRQPDSCLTKTLSRD